MKLYSVAFVAVIGCRRVSDAFTTAPFGVKVSRRTKMSYFSTTSDEDIETSKLETTKIIDVENEAMDMKLSSFQLSVEDMRNVSNVAQEEEEEEEEYSIWHNRVFESWKRDPKDSDYVLADADDIANDPVLNLMASEVGVKELIHILDKNKDSIPSSGLPLPVLLERSMDTVEDIWQHLRRIPYEKGAKVLSEEEELTRKTVVVLGSGWAAHALMKVADCNKLRLIVVSPSNHFVFTPMLASAAVGTVEYRSMTEAVRAANPMIDQYIEGSATDIDVKKQKVTVKLNSLLDGVREGEPPTIELDYDHLIVSVGCRVDNKGVPGAEKCLRLKSCDDARKLRTAVGECFEYASRPDAAGDPEERTKRATFLIVGGGATGIELSGELFDLAEDITRPHKGTYPKLKGNVRVILVHSGPDLVPQFEQNLRNEALRSLRNKGVEVILNTRVTEVGDGYAKLSTKIFDEETGEVTGRKDSMLHTGLSVWCAGTAPVSFVDQLLQQLPESARNYDGRIKVDKWMRPQMKDGAELGSILVLGDAAAFPDKEMYDSLLPQTAQVAGQQGAYAARLLSRGYDLESTPPAQPCTPLAPDVCDVFNDPLLKKWLEFRGLEAASKFTFLNLGLLAYLGGGEALSQVQVGDIPVFAYGGSVAFILWRSVYLVKQVATKNRVLVTFDWIKSSLFGRDMTRL